MNHNEIFKCFSNLLNIFENGHTYSIVDIFIIIKFLIHPLTILLMVFIIGICFLLYLTNKHNQLEQNKMEVYEVENVTSESMTYIITYIVPFLSLNFNSTANLYCIIVLIATIGIIYVNSDMLYINPLLNSFGYKTFKISGKMLNLNKSTENMFIITPKKISRIHKNDIVNFLQYDEGILIASNISQ